jgi:hypothetical protein
MLTATIQATMMDRSRSFVGDGQHNGIQPPNSPIETTACSSLPNTRSYKTRSASIPISNSIRRTHSENELDQDEAEADYNDYMFFSRIVEGMSRKLNTKYEGKTPHNDYLRYQNQMSLANVVRTRHAITLPLEEEELKSPPPNFGYVEHMHSFTTGIDSQSYHAEPADYGDIFELDL